METLKCRIDAPETYLMLSFEHEVEVGLNEVESGALGRIPLSQKNAGIRKVGAFVVQKMQKKILVFCRNTNHTLEINFKNPAQAKVLPWPETVTMDIVSGGVSRGTREAKSVTVLRVRRDSVEIETDPGKNQKKVPVDPPPVYDNRDQLIADQKKKIAEQEKRIAVLEQQNQALTGTIQQNVNQAQVNLTSLSQSQAKLVNDLARLTAESEALSRQIAELSDQCRELRTGNALAKEALRTSEGNRDALEKELRETQGAAAEIEKYITERRKTLMAQHDIMEFDADALKKAVEDDQRHLRNDQVASQFLSADPVLYSNSVDGLLKEAEETLHQADEQLSRLIHLREAIDQTILESIQAGDGKMEIGKEAGYGITASDTEEHDKTAAGN